MGTQNVLLLPVRKTIEILQFFSYPFLDLGTFNAGSEK